MKSNLDPTFKDDNLGVRIAISRANQAEGLKSTRAGPTNQKNLKFLKEDSW